jgi:hypothetical protein
MEEHRVGRIASADLRALAAHRGRRGWALRAEGPKHFWLRVPAADEAAFRMLPLTGRWSPDDEGRMVRDGRRVVESVLPDDGWQPLTESLPLAPPRRNMPGMAPAPAAFELVRAEEEQPAGALLCRLEDFAAWTDTAITPRLSVLDFAAAADGRAFICGHPLPPVKGGVFHRAGRLWLPCGWQLPEHAWPELLEEMLGLGRSRTAIFHADGGHEILADENRVPATRAAVRTTARRMRERSEG